VDYSTKTIDDLSQFGCIEGLQWKLSNEEFSPDNYSNWAIDIASQKGLIGVLDWWLRLWRNSDSNLRLKYTNWAIDYASKEGRTNILDWWKQSGLEIKYTNWAIDHASAEGHMGVLEWFLASGLKIKYSEWAVIDAVKNKHNHVLRWWLDNSDKLRLGDGTIFYLENKLGIKYHYACNIKNIVELSDQSCAICYDNFEIGTNVNELRCGHIYHSECIDSWIKDLRNKYCPYCRKSVLRKVDGV